MNIKVRLHGKANWLKECGYSFDEEKQIYDDQLIDVLTHTRWYLDNLEYLPTYRVRWKDYRNKRPTLPHKYCNDDTPL
jgi:hypothetical protein